MGLKEELTVEDRLWRVMFELPIGPHPGIV